jgi:hypothetical protein
VLLAKPSGDLFTSTTIRELANRPRNNQALRLPFQSTIFCDRLIFVKPSVMRSAESFDDLLAGTAPFDFTFFVFDCSRRQGLKRIQVYIKVTLLNPLAVLVT